MQMLAVSQQDLGEDIDFHLFFFIIIYLFHERAAIQRNALSKRQIS